MGNVPGNFGVNAVSTAVGYASAQLGSLGSEAWHSLNAVQGQAAYQELCRLESQVASLKLAAVRRLESLDAARQSGATSTGALLATVTDGDRPEHERLVRTAGHLVQAGAQATQDALGEAQLSLRQVEIIAQALNALPPGITAAQRQEAERTLVADAGRLRLPQLRRRGERLADELTALGRDGDVDATEDDRLRRRELAARATSRFSMWDNHDGTHAGQFRIPDVEAAALRAALQAMTAPRRRGHLGTGAGDLAAGAVGSVPVDQEDSGCPALDGARSGPVTPGAASHRGLLSKSEPAFTTGVGYAARNGSAFADLLLRLPTDGLPQHGGTGALITVNIDLDALTGTVARAGAVTGSGVKMSAAAVRHLACRTGILPMVLGGDSLPLDLGREQRLFSRGQRLALAQRDQGCAFPGCDRPPGWCEAHHIAPWARGGPTSIRNAVLVCARHHHLIDELGYQLRVRADGLVEFRHPAQQEWKVNERFLGPPLTRMVG